MVKVNSRTIQRLYRGTGSHPRGGPRRGAIQQRQRLKQDNSVLQRQAETEQALGNPLHPRGQPAFRTRGIICS